MGSASTEWPPLPAIDAKPQSFPGLGAAVLPRSVLVDGRRYTFRAPLVWEALAIGDVLPGAVGGEADDLRALNDVLRGWLPPEVYTHVVELVPTAFTSVLRRLLDDGGDLGAPAPKPGKKASRSPLPYDVVLADVCDVYGADPWVVLSTWPWPLFLRLARSARTASARTLRRWAEIEILPHTGKNAKSAIDRLDARADGEDLQNPNAPIPGASAEEIQASRERLRALWGVGKRRSAEGGD